MKLEINGTPEEVREFLSKGAEAQGNIELTPVQENVSDAYRGWGRWLSQWRYSRSKCRPEPIQGMDTNHMVNALVKMVDDRSGTGIGLFEDDITFRALIVNLAWRIREHAEQEE